MMMRGNYGLWCLGLLALVGSVTVACAQEAKAPVKVTLQVTDEPVAKVAEKLTELTGIQIGVIAPGEAKVTLDLKEVTIEQAVKAFAEAFEASWIRAYVLESRPPDKPYTPEQLIAGLENQRENWFESLSDEQRAALMESWRGTRGPREGEAQAPAVMPGAGRSSLGRRGPGGPGQPGQPGQGGQPGQPPVEGQAPAAAQGQGGPQGQGGLQGPGQGQGGQRGGMRLFDPVGQLILPVRSETITLELPGVPLNEAIFDLTTVSGFIVAAGGDLRGEVTLKAENKPLEEVIAEVAKAVSGQWRPLYLLSVPRELSEAEQEQRMEQRFQSRWARYWAKSPEERAQDIQQQVERINRWAEMARRPAQDGQPNRAAQGLQRRGQRMLSRLATYSASLTPAQRMELKPLMRALGAAIGQPAQ